MAMHNARVKPCPAEGHGDRFIVICACGLVSQCWGDLMTARDIASMHNAAARLAGEHGD